MKITKFLSAVLLILTGCFGGEQKQTPGHTMMNPPSMILIEQQGAIGSCTAN